MMNDEEKTLLTIFLSPLIFFFVWIEYLLWNSCLCVGLTICQPITYWQMFGIDIFCWLCLKSHQRNDKNE